MREMFNGSWPTWSEVPKSHRELMWERFQGTYEWDSEFHEKAKENWEGMMSARHRDMMRDARKKAIKKVEDSTGFPVGDDLSVLKPYHPEWIDADNWATIIDKFWNIDTWKKDINCESAKQVQRS